MMLAGLAYMDDTPPDQMKVERENRQASKHRESQTPDQALEYFNLMCSGSDEGSAWCGPNWHVVTTEQAVPL